MRTTTVDTWLGRALLGLSGVALLALLLDVGPELAGGRPFVPWLAWIPMCGFPLAFVLMLVMLGRAVSRRRSL